MKAGHPWMIKYFPAKAPPSPFLFTKRCYGNSPKEPNPSFLHTNIVKNGTLHHLDVANHLLSLYVKSDNLMDAQKLFDDMENRNVRTWTTLITHFAKNGNSRLVLSLFNNMQVDGVLPNQFTLSSVYKCCCLNEGKAVHGWIVRRNVGLDTVLENAILDFYLKCGLFSYGSRLFEMMGCKNSVSWNIMISGCLRTGDREKAFELFRGLSKKDVASWNTIIDGLRQNGDERMALELVYQMVLIGPVFDTVTFSIALVLVTSLSMLELGRQLHGMMIRVGLYNNGFVVNSLIDMYSKCGEIDKALTAFMNVTRLENCPEEAVVEAAAWSSMVSGCVQNGRWKDAFKMFSYMMNSNVELDKYTLTSMVCACTSAGVLELGCQIHACIHKIGHHLDAFLYSSMIDMYTKCGSLSDAHSIFRQVKYKNTVLWTSMISGCAVHGQGQKAVRLFESMTGEGIPPNEITFVAVLTACAHAGLIEEGCKYFRMMKEVYSIKPSVVHFTCMVDLYGRAGRLQEAKEFIYENRVSHLSSVWRPFLSSCRLNKNTEMAKSVSRRILQLEPADPEPYVLLSNLCANDKRWEESAELRSSMKKRGIKKNPGQSWISLRNQVHSFVMGDVSHPQSSDIYSYLDKLIGRLKEIGYTCDLKMVMQDVEEEQGEVLLSYHSEKLAIAFAIMNTSPEMPIQVMKNLRICYDCHNFIKYASQLLSREIIVRDIRRFHHFKHGQCSCGDYW